MSAFNEMMKRAVSGETADVPSQITTGNAARFVALSDSEDNAITVAQVLDRGASPPATDMSI